MPATTPRLPRRRFAPVLLLAGLVVALSACAHDVPSEEEFAQALRSSGIPAAEARCAAKALYTELTPGQVRAVMERGASGVPKNDPDDTDDAADRLAAAMTKCREEADAAEVDDGGPTTTSSSVPTSLAPSEPSTTGPGFNTTDGGGSSSSTSPSSSPSSSTTEG